MDSALEFYSVEVSCTEFTVPVRYQNLLPLGTGAQGFVCSALDTRSQQMVAIKKLAKPLQNVTCAKRVYRELKVMKMVHHKNIVRLLDVFTPNRSLQDFRDVYLVMELMETSLCGLTTKTWDHDRLSYVMYQILCGLRHLHLSGIIHRDLKPSNIAVNSDCSLKILDFGLARTNPGANFQLTEYVTTRYYRAPEVIMRMRYTENVDVWALGCILAELVLGYVLFRGSGHIDQWNKIIDRLGTPPPSFFVQLSPTVRQYVQSQPRVEGDGIERIITNSVFHRPDDTEESKQEIRRRTKQLQDLLARMLTIDPGQRISVDGALAHDYIKTWREPDELTEPEAKLDVFEHCLGDAEFTIEQWKEMIYQEAVNFKNQLDSPQ